MKILKSPSAYPLPPGFNGHLAPLYRWFSGRPLNGHRYTDATGFRYGTMATDISGKATWYQMLPGYRRFLVTRLPAMAMPAVATVAILWPRPTLWAVAILATVAIPPAVAMAKVATFRRAVIEPLAMATATITRERATPGHGHARVEISPDFRDNPMATVAIRLPRGWVGDKGDKARIAETVATHLNLEDVVPTWSLGGRSPVVTFALPAKPPAMVSFAEGVAMATEQGPLLAGVGSHGHRVDFDLELDSPHLAIAGGTGAGKSVFIAWLVAQFLRRGAGVLVLDAKFVSHMWLRRIPGVAYASETEELHDALIWLDRELLRRARFVAAGGDPDELERLVAVLEEMNGATNRLRAYWKDELGGKGMSPALTALGNLSAMGREMKLHIIMAGQSLTGKATGGPENRENFGARALARATANQWRMLAPQIRPAPLRKQGPGRWHLVVGDVLKELQVPFSDLKDPAELIAWATAGEVFPDVPAMMAGLSSQSSTSANARARVSTTVRGVSLADYVQDRPGLSLGQLQKWRERYADSFPEQVGSRGKAKLYEPAELDQFVSARVS